MKILIPNDILNPLWDKDEKEEEEEVGGRVADELQEGFPHHLVRWHNMFKGKLALDGHLWERRTWTADVAEGVEGEEETNSGNLHSLTKSDQNHWWL